MRYLLLALFLLAYFRIPTLAADGRDNGTEATQQVYRLLPDTLSRPLPRELPPTDNREADSRVRLALSSRLVQPPSEEAEELERIERISIFIGLRCLLD